MPNAAPEREPPDEGSAIDDAFDERGDEVEDPDDDPPPRNDDAEERDE